MSFTSLAELVVAADCCKEHCNTPSETLVRASSYRQGVASESITSDAEGVLLMQVLQPRSSLWAHWPAFLECTPLSLRCRPHGVYGVTAGI